ncbi:MAG: MBL fold metallo-hydrolase [Tissierellia bacterium]|nr:MBL fold metallo-hydrolase [Tissierellia bacterium]
MKRPWFFWGLVAFLISFAKIIGMELSFIPILLLLLLYLPKKKWLILLIILRLLLMDNLPHDLQGQARIRSLSPLKEDNLVEIGGRTYLLSYQNLIEGVYNCSFTIEDFSAKRGPLGFCEKDYYSSLGISAKAIGWKGELVEERASLLTKLRKALYDRGQVFGDYQGLAYSLVFGLKEGLSPEEKGLFQSMGLMHLFVVSGLHLGIYYRAILRLTSYIGWPRIVGEALGLLLLLFFGFLSDFHVSSVRTILVILVETVAFHKKVKVDPIEMIGFIGLVIILYRPSYATSFSFVLGTISYGVLRISRDHSLIKMYLIMLPLQLLFLPEVRILNYLTNSLLAGLMGLLLPLLMLAFVFRPLAWISATIFTSLMGLLSFLNNSFFSWYLGALGWFSLIIFYLFIFLLPLFRESKVTYKLVQNKKFLLVVFALWLGILKFENSYRLEGVRFLDVGQGDASLIITEDKKTILIDTGKGRPIHDHLHSLGIKKLDVIFISHFDEDHSKELDKLNYDRLYFPKGSNYPGGYPLEKGDIINYQGLIIRILSPDVLYYDGNEDSLVMLVEYKEKKILYTGDVGVKRLAQIEGPKVDILKYPHHGSRHSLNQEYLKKIEPSMVILSYGNNRYGHPHKEVMDFLEDRFEYFETGKSGSFHLKAGGYRNY